MAQRRRTVAVILAGGPGERLWPLSRPGRPKPLVEVGGETLLGRAFKRALQITKDPNDIFVIALEADRTRMLEALPELPQEHFLGEPMRRDTAMAVLFAAEMVAQQHESATLAILPADHVMRDEEAFSASALLALQLAAEQDGICLLGAVPTGPRQEFGYIVSRADEQGPCAVERFVEKPDGELAVELIAAGALWNMGVFIGDVRSLVATAEIVAPEVEHSAHEAARAFLANDLAALGRAYAAAARLPFDRAVLEHATDLRVIPCDAGWSDLGNWPEFVRFHRELLGEDEALLWHEPGAPPLQVLGADDLIVANTPAGSLVATVHASARVRPPKSQGPSFVPDGARVVEKPWGAEHIWAQTDRYAGKLLYVKAGESLSLQYHEQKMESMWVLQGSGVLEIDGRPIAIGPGTTMTILPGTLHRLIAHVDLSVLEVSSPELDDVVRVQDIYGRS